jgi:argininosuccinate lyase
VFDAEDLMIGCARTTAIVVERLSLRADRTRTAASGLLLATEVADYLVERGVPFRTAHEITGRIVRELHEQGRDFSSFTLADWQRHDARFDAAILQRITPESAVATKRTPQSTHPDAVAAALAEATGWLQRRRTGPTVPA